MFSFSDNFFYNIKKAKLYHMLSFTYHDCIFFQYVKETEEEALKIIRDLVEKKNEK